MPRQERQPSATGIYHVMLRGINKQDIFEDADDIKEKIAELSGILIPTGIQRLSKNQRNAILKQLCDYGANIRQISRITGVSYGVIYRAKSGS